MSYSQLVTSAYNVVLFPYCLQLCDEGCREYGRWGCVDCHPGKYVVTLKDCDWQFSNAVPVYCTPALIITFITTGTNKGSQKFQS